MLKKIITYLTLSSFINTCCLQPLMAMMVEELPVQPPVRHHAQQLMQYEAPLDQNGAFVLDGKHFQGMPSFYLDLTSQGEAIGTLSSINGKMILNSNDPHHFLLRNLPQNRSLKVAIGGSIIVDSPLEGYHYLRMLVAGKASFLHGFNLAQEGTACFSGGLFECFEQSSAPAIVLANLDTFTIKNDSRLDCELMLTHGDVKNLKALGDMRVSLGQLKLKSLTSKSSKFDALTLTAHQVTNNGFFDVKHGDVDIKQLTNNGEMAFASLNAKGCWHNKPEAKVTIHELFKGEFDNYTDDGSTQVDGFAYVKADHGRLTGQFQGRNAIFTYAQDVLVPQCASFCLQHHFSLNSLKSLQFFGALNMKFHPEWPHVAYSDQTREMLRGLPAGAYLSAVKDLTQGGDTTSANSSVHFSAGGKYSGVGGKVRSGFFENNHINIKATEARLTEELHSYHDTILKARVAELLGARNINGTLYLSVDHLLQHKGDQMKAGSVMLKGEDARLGGTIELTNQMQLTMTGLFQTLTDSLIQGGALIALKQEKHHSLGNCEILFLT